MSPIFFALYARDIEVRPAVNLAFARLLGEPESFGRFKSDDLSDLDATNVINLNIERALKDNATIGITGNADTYLAKIAKLRGQTATDKYMADFCDNTTKAIYKKVIDTDPEHAFNLYFNSPELQEVFDAAMKEAVAAPNTGDLKRRIDLNRQMEKSEKERLTVFNLVSRAHAVALRETGLSKYDAMGVGLESNYDLPLMQRVFEAVAGVIFRNPVWAPRSAPAQRL